jgi:hypothetical protein
MRAGWFACKISISVASFAVNGGITIMRPLKKRCRILPAGGLGVSPSFKKVPQDWGI